MEYAILLHKYYNKLVDTAQDSKSNLNDAIPPIPPIPEIIKKYQKNAFHFNAQEIM